MNNLGRSLLVWIAIILAIVMAFVAFQPKDDHAAAQQLAYSDFVNDVEKGQVRSVIIREKNISGKLNDGVAFHTYAPEDPSLVSRLTSKGVEVSAKPREPEGSPILRAVINYLPIVLMVGVVILFLRQMQMGSGKAMSFGRSRARLMGDRQGKVTFKDVAGIDEAKGELEEIVDFLKDPQKFTRLGGKIPKGALLVGPPGTGKTLLARAIAGEANVPFFSISGSDFVEMFVGVGASRVRDMFEQGKKAAPCIIFIDEIDAVGRHRGAGLGGGNDEREQTLNQMLVEMDGFESNEGVILVAATNRPDVLDPALLRPGRFDRQVVVPNPDIVGREAILRVHMRKVPLGSDVNPRVIARGTPGFSGADLANIVNEAALMAARQGRRAVSMRELEAAKDKVLMGAERRSTVLKEQDKRVIAFHEAGHAVCAFYTPGSDPIHKATIIPRGMALGLVMMLPEDDMYNTSRKQFLARLVIAMGGRAAEELTFGKSEVSGGASGDIKSATGTARRMITELGMSDRLGMVAYESSGQEVFLGHSVTQNKTVSEATAQEIDREVRDLIDNAYQKALSLLKTHHDGFTRVAEALLEYETITGEEIAGLLEGQPIKREDVVDDGPENRRASVPTLLSGWGAGARLSGQAPQQG